jgi:hypothetical protein
MFGKHNLHAIVFLLNCNTITGSPDARRGTVMFIHGAPTQSFSYRTVMAQVSFIDRVF